MEKTRQAAAQARPSIVIVGRPNVGKSTLFNRLTGTRRSIVTNEPGITRDRIYGSVNWEGKSFELVDTGGIVPDDKAGIPGEILRQANFAIKNATRVVQIVDGRVGPTPLDQELALLMRRAGKPPIIVVNKVDIPRQAELAAQFYELGDEIFPVSAEHGYGVDVLLDALTEDMEKSDAEPSRPYVNLAIIGRPNVGKSTLLNRLAGVERAIVSDIPGTTRDAVDTVVEHGGRTYRFVDTAGIRRKGKTNLVAEKMSVMMARRHLEQADVALLVVDASLGVTANDANIAGYAEESGRSVIIVMNKWDLALEAAAEKARRELEHQSPKTHVAESSFRQEATRARTRGRKHTSVVRKKAVTGRVDPAQLVKDYEEIVRTRFKFLDYAPIVFVSAKTGERTEKLFDLIDHVADARRRRISTGELNRWVAEVDLDRGTSPAARRVKIYYVTQASTSPPTFILFTNQSKRLHFSYERFLENLLRKSFDFLGTPIRFLQRLKEKREHGSRPSGRTRTAT